MSEPCIMLSARLRKRQPEENMFGKPTYPQKTGLTKEFLEEARAPIRRAAFLGFVITVLALAPSWYMLEVYDRVLNSMSLPTLAMLTLLVMALYVVMEILEWTRGELLQNLGLLFEKRYGERVFDAVMQASLRQVPGAMQGINDMRTLREFFSAPALTALLDAPMASLFLLLLFLIHPALGAFALLFALGQVYLAYQTERSTQPPLVEANRMAISAQNYAQGTLRSAQVVEAMGMLPAILQRWMKRQRRFLELQALASDRAGSRSAIAKALQNILSSGLMGLAAWLLLQQSLPGGGAMLIIASILGARAMTPLVQLIASWKQVVEARDARDRLDKFLLDMPERPAGMSLPAPSGNLSVEGLVASAPGSQIPILRGLSFALPAGKCLVVVGPSAAGKSTLARLLVGVWLPMAGKVRLDGADIHAWNKSELGPHIGYLPQGVELFDGTLAENIARFGEIDMTKVIAAAQLVGLHDMIMQLPNGYESRIGEDGCILSGGQRQRVGLARAIYGEPRFLVLDEPNAHLDEEGDRALLSCLLEMKRRGATLVVISHRTSVLPAADAMLILRDGQITALGPRDEILAALAKAQQPSATPPARAGSMTDRT
ncbi:MAG: type I secretion system permease/ATPase [Rhodocyclaceae bacterium]|nr:type I secretion system permease/ATPase [Rhodocyclaceae bacterium]